MGNENWKREFFVTASCPSTKDANKGPRLGDSGPLLCHTGHRESCRDRPGAAETFKAIRSVNGIVGGLPSTWSWRQRDLSAL